MGTEPEPRGVRVTLIVVIASLATAMSFELLRDSHQAFLNANWRRHHDSFESYIHRKEQKLARHASAASAAPENLPGRSDDDEL